GFPPFAEVFGDGAIEFMHQPRSDDCHEAFRLHESSEITEIKVVRAVIHKRINAHYCVKKVRREWQLPRIRVNWEHARLYVGISNALEIFRGAKPKVRGPNLHAELAMQKNRRGSSSAAKIKDSHSRPEVQRSGQPLGQLKRVGPSARASRDPFRIV